MDGMDSNADHPSDTVWVVQNPAWFSILCPSATYATTGERSMKKPLIFALRGAAGFGLPTLFIYGAVSLPLSTMAAQNRAGTVLLLSMLGCLFLAGMLAAPVVLYYRTEHWVRASLGFVLFSVPASVALADAIWTAKNIGHGGGNSGEAISVVAIYGIGPAVYMGIGASFKRLDLALRASVAFAVPGLILASVLMLTQYHGTFLWTLAPPISGAWYGYFVGRAEERIAGAGGMTAMREGQEEQGISCDGKCAGE